MNKAINLFLFLFSFIFFSGIGFAQITSAGSGNWSDGSTWNGGAVPTSNDNVVIAVGHTVTIDSADAECNSISFGDATAKLAMGSAASLLSVYGNFTLASPTHQGFSTWTSGAKIRFTGRAIQTLSGWSTSGFSTSFDELVIDKTGGKVVTTGTNMRLGIGTSLEIVQGTFELASTDDIETRNYSGTATTANITVQPSGIFNMVGSGSHIRSGSNSSVESSKIGLMTVYGTVNIRSTSGNRVNIGNINIESGGFLLAGSFNATNPGLFNAGTVTIKAGGELKVTTGTDFWEPTTSQVLLENEGVYSLSVADPVNSFPPAFINNGTVQYNRSGDQIIKDMDYHSLVISSGNKTWALSEPRTVTDSLELNDNANLILSGTSSQTITVNGILLFSNNAGSITTNANTLVLAAGASISGELSGRYVVGNLTTTRSVGTGSSTMGNIGVEFSAGPDDVGEITITRISGVQGIVTNPDDDNKKGIARKWKITSANPPVNGRDIIFGWISDDDNGIELANGTVWKSINNGTSWVQIGNGDYSDRTATVSGETSFGDYTISSADKQDIKDIVKDVNIESFLNRIKLTWNSNGSYNYEIRFDTDSSMSEAVVIEADTSIAVITQLDPAATYYIQIRAAIGSVWSDWSEVIKTKTADIEISVTTYNVLGQQHDGTHPNNTWSMRKEAVRNIIMQQNNYPDILGAQEVREIVQINELSSLLSSDYNSYISNIATSPRAIFWKKNKFTLVSSDDFQLFTLNDTYGTTFKYATYVRLKEVSGREFYVFNVHLSFGSTTLAQQARFTSAINLYTKIKELTDGFDIPAILIGDFNSSGTVIGGIESAPKTFKDNGLIDAYDYALYLENKDYATTNNIENATAKTGLNESSRLDYIFVYPRNKFGVWDNKNIINFESGSTINLQKPVPSDHNPVRATLHLSYDSASVVGVKKDESLPQKYMLLQNYPNPFNPNTTIRFSIPQKDKIKLAVYDILGREVVTLIDKELSPGNHKVIWDGKDEFGNSNASGVYFYWLLTSSNDFVQVKKLMKIK